MPRGASAATRGRVICSIRGQISSRSTDQIRTGGHLRPFSEGQVETEGHRAPYRVMSASPLAKRAFDFYGEIIVGAVLSSVYQKNMYFIVILSGLSYSIGVLRY